MRVPARPRKHSSVAYTFFQGCPVPTHPRGRPEHPKIPAPHPARSQPHPNKPLTSQQPATQPPTTHTHGPQNRDGNTPQKGGKRPHSTVSTTTPQGSTSHLERTPRTQVQTRRARTSHEQPAPDPTDKTTTTRGRPKAPHQNTSDSRTHPCTPSLHTSQQKQEATDANGNEKESMKNHRVAHAAPPCITRSLFHTVYVQNLPTCTPNTPSRPPPPTATFTYCHNKSKPQTRGTTQHPSKQAQRRTGKHAPTAASN